VPVFFAVTGIKLLAAPHAVISWSAIAVGTALAILGKTVGTYVSARLARRSHGDGLRLGALMNTRGLTEIIFLQAGYAAGVLPAALFIALTVMALLTTALTGPVLRLIDRNEARAGRSPARKADDRRALTTQ
jgi:Kef-type K+ transport system membrane component KefB